MKSENFFLMMVILGAISTRVLFIWIGRPEFVGWFNHTYYYYVEVKSLMENGSLAFPDMPLLFYLYAQSARVFMAFGMEMKPAIVNATRFWMSVIPSLVAIPTYLFIRSVHPQPKTLHIWMLLLIFCSAFIPLSLLYMPEFLQKNTLGLLLLAFFLMLFRRTIQGPNRFNYLFLFISFLIICLTHFGTAGASVLYLFSAAIAFFVEKKKGEKSRRLGLIVLIGLLLALGVFYLFDINRLERVYYYLLHSYQGSFVGQLISSQSDLNSRGIALAGIGLPLLFFGGIFWIYHKSLPRLSEENRLFWLSLIIFSYLLIFPFFDQLLMGRFSLFMNIPFIFIIAYVLKFGIEKQWLKKSLAVLMILGAVGMAIGELMSLKFHNRDRAQVYEDLMKMQKEVNFKKNDFILTRNGAEHISNWFLGVKAGLIPSFHRQDFQKYHQVYILNPRDGTPTAPRTDERNPAKEILKYNFMRLNIPPPDEGESVYSSAYLELIRLDRVPQTWEFDEEGNWQSY